jgi:ABC-type multidrug transport system fused ATPase/permease subunit
VSTPNCSAQAEKREEGSVKWAVFAAYAKAFPGGWHTVALLFALNMVKQLAGIGATLWLAVWSAKRLSNWTDGAYLGMYAFISIAVAVLTYIKSLAFTYCGIEAASTLHARLLRAVLNARLTFFDVTPLGRILQRFSRDTDTIDNALPAGWNSTAEFVLGLITVILTICVIEPTMIPFFLPIGFLYFRVQAYFRSSYREIKRLDSTSGSPIFSHFAETLAGLQTIRACVRACVHAYVCVCCVLTRRCAAALCCGAVLLRAALATRGASSKKICRAWPRTSVRSTRSAAPATAGCPCAWRRWATRLC